MRSSKVPARRGGRRSKRENGYYLKEKQSEVKKNIKSGSYKEEEREREEILREGGERGRERGRGKERERER